MIWEYNHIVCSGKVPESRFFETKSMDKYPRHGRQIVVQQERNTR